MMPPEIEAWFFSQGIAPTSTTDKSTFLEIMANNQSFRYFKKSGVFKHYENGQYVEINKNNVEEISLF